MKTKERIIWISVVSVLLVVLMFGVFVNDASAGTINSGFPYVQKFLNVLSMVKKEYVDETKVDDKKLINGAIKGMIDAIGDPHTNYLSVDDMEEMNQTSDGKFGGVGMIIQEKDGYILVVSPIEDTPAYRKGMKPGDLLITVDGKSLKGLSVSDASKALKGTPGTTVKVGFIRNNENFEVDLTRAEINVPTVKSSFIDNDKYGYLRITQFAGTTDTYVKDALKKFMDKKVKGIIVDLRYNPGGLLSQVIRIVNFFQDEGVIVSTKGRNAIDSSVNKASKINDIIPKDIPVIVLVDQGSASASEIFSGAMKDNKRGILIGEKTFGKGSVQTIHQLGEDGFKITIAKYYTPSGICIDGIGIEPDIEVKDPVLSDDEQTALKKIYKDKVIENFVSKNKTPSDAEINNFVNDLQKKGYNLNDRNLKKLIKNETEIYTEKKSIYDLEYDLQLKKALEVLNNGDMIYKDGKYSVKGK